MWDFSVGETLAIVARTWPFVLLRLAIYFSITFAYLVATGAGAGVGYGVGHIWSDPEGPAGFALGGGIIGFGLVSVAIYWLREYLLYMVKAGHIAAMVHIIDRRPLPGGQGQVAYARAVVERRFVEANALFVLDQLIKGAIAAIAGLLIGVASVLPIPGLRGLAGFVSGVIRISLTYVDEIILGRNIRIDSQDPFETARQGVVLYAQNGRRMVKNAVWLALFMWIVTLAVFLMMLAPAAAILYAMPGQLAGWAFVFALVFAWALKAALLEPIAIAALMSVYFRTIDGQVPDPAWDDRLAQVSGKFRELKDRALGAAGATAARPG